MRNIAKHKVIIIILLLALLVRGVFFVAFWHNIGLSNDKIIFQGDAEEYHSLAVNLIKGNGFVDYEGIVTSRRTPIYPLFVAAIYSLFGIKPYLVLLIQMFIDVFVCLLIYLLALLVFNNKKIALLSGLLYAIEPVSAVYSLTLNTETFFVFIFVLSLLALVTAVKEQRMIWFGIAGMLLGLAVLTRPVALYFFIIAILAILLLNRKQTIKAIVVFFLMFELVLSFWQLRNYAHFKTFNLISIQGEHLFQNVVVVEANRLNLTEDEVKPILLKSKLPQRYSDNFKNSKVYQEIALEYIRTHSKDYLRIHFKGILNMFIHSTKYEVMRIFGLERKTLKDEGIHSFSISDRLKRVIATAKDEYYLTFILLSLSFMEYFLCFVGFIGLLIKKHWKLAIIFAVIIAYYSLMSGVVGHARYKLPIIPIYLMVSSYGIVILAHSLNSFKQKQRKTHSKKLAS